MDLEALAVARADEQLEAGAWRHREPYEHGPVPLVFRDNAAPKHPRGERGVFVAKPKVRCAAHGCCRSARAKGLCDTHYRLQMRDGMSVAEYRARRRAMATEAA